MKGIYINRTKRNDTEYSVQQYFISQGYDSLARGWPDFLFFKFDNKGKIEAVFVEVKRSNQNCIKSHQNTIRKLLGHLGIEVKVCFGMNEDGTPNFKRLDRNGKILKET